MRFTHNQVAALNFCQSGLALAISIGSSESQSLALQNLAMIKTMSGDFLGATEDALESQRAAKITGNLFNEVYALRLEAYCRKNLGSFSHCVSLLDKASHLLDLCGMSGGDIHDRIRITQAESIGSSKRQSLALCELAWIKRDSGDFLGAKEDASESQRATKIVGNLFADANALRAEAICWYELGSYSSCRSLLDRAVHLLGLCGKFGGTIHSNIRTSQAELHRCKEYGGP
jgi:tetratricopeptide (TPR) repeat protein